MTDRMLPEDAAFSAATDNLVAAITGPWPPDPVKFASALSVWSRLLIERAGTQSLSSVRVLADDAVRRAVAPLDERVGELERRVGASDAENP